MLPPEYSTIVADGIQALRWIEVGLRARADRELASAALWLGVRDAGGLADRLESHNDWTWQTGFAGVMLSPQDLGVLDEFIRSGSEPSPYRRDGTAQSLPDHGERLRALRAFLARYRAREFDFEDPEAYPHVESESPAG